VIAVCTPATVVFNDSLMSLVITFMFVPAKLQMNWASARGTSALRAACDGRADTACSITHSSSYVAREAFWDPASQKVEGRAPWFLTCSLHQYGQLACQIGVVFSQERPEPPYRGPVSLPWVLVHMVEEHARHNGHADLLGSRFERADENSPSG
jgi:hypothetical protein